MSTSLTTALDSPANVCEQRARGASPIIPGGRADFPNPANHWVVSAHVATVSVLSLKSYSPQLLWGSWQSDHRGESTFCGTVTSHFSLASEYTEPRNPSAPQPLASFVSFSFFPLRRGEGGILRNNLNKWTLKSKNICYKVFQHMQQTFASHLIKITDFYKMLIVGQTLCWTLDMGSLTSHLYDVGTW